MVVLLRASRRRRDTLASSAGQNAQIVTSVQISSRFAGSLVLGVALVTLSTVVGTSVYLADRLPFRCLRPRPLLHDLNRTTLPTRIVNRVLLDDPSGSSIHRRFEINRCRLTLAAATHELDRAAGNMLTALEVQVDLVPVGPLDLLTVVEGRVERFADVLAVIAVRNVLGTVFLNLRMIIFAGT